MDNTYSFLLGDSRLYCETSLERPTEAPTTVPEYVRRGKYSRNVVGFTLPTSERKRMLRKEERETENGKGSATKRGSGGELETRFASCRHLEAISYRFTRAPTKVSVHLHLESSLGIVRYRYCNVCYEYWSESLWVGFMTCTTRSHATERRETLKLLLQPF